MIRPDVVLYEEQLPENTDDAITAICAADTLIIAGTSLTVYPAANFVRCFGGNHIVLLNMERPENLALNKDKDLFIQGNMSEAFVAILRYISEVK